MKIKCIDKPNRATNLTIGKIYDVKLDLDLTNFILDDSGNWHPIAELGWMFISVRDENSQKTLRDEFAIAAMNAIVRRYDCHAFGGGKNPPEYKELAEDAYYITNHMMKVREENEK